MREDTIEMMGAGMFPATTCGFTSQMYDTSWVSTSAKGQTATELWYVTLKGTSGAY